MNGEDSVAIIPTVATTTTMSVIAILYTLGQPKNFTLECVNEPLIIHVKNSRANVFPPLQLPSAPFIPRNDSWFVSLHNAPSRVFRGCKRRADYSCAAAASTLTSMSTSSSSSSVCCRYNLLTPFNLFRQGSLPNAGSALIRNGMKWNQSHIFSAGDNDSSPAERTDGCFVEPCRE